MNDDADAEIGREIQAGKVSLWLLLGVLLGALVLAASVALWREARERGRVAGYSEGWRAARAMAQLDLEGQQERERMDAQELLDCKSALRESLDREQPVCPALEADAPTDRATYLAGLNEGLRLGREDWKARGFDCLARGRAVR